MEKSNTWKYVGLIALGIVTAVVVGMALLNPVSPFFK